MVPAVSDPDPLLHQAGKTAVIDLTSGRRLSHADLDHLADRAAAWITRRLGAPPGERVAYLGRNGIELLALALGAERCGAIFVPLNWRLATAEIAALRDDCAPKLLVAQREFALSLPGALDSAEALSEVEATPPAVAQRLDPNRPIILLYTSGTTGRPKGVIVTAANAEAAADDFAAVGEVDGSTVAFSDLPMFHTIGLIAVARTTLSRGGTLLVADRFSPTRTLNVLGDPGYGVTHYFAVPVMAEALAKEPGFDPSRLRRLHAIFLGGAPLSPELIERFLAYGVPLVNGYGMSEAGTAIHVPIDREAVRRSAGAVGLPAPQIAVRLVRDGVDVAEGEVGEVWLRGPSVTPGYWGAPKETVAAFTDGWYRTGDLARREASGFYRIVDRLKDMYVSGGENVYPAEVETALLKAPGVVDAAVLGVPDARWGETGVAFVVMHAETPFDPAALVAHCAAQLAKFKCPARIVAMDAIPRSAAGKILKPQLRAKYNSGEFG